MKRIALISMLGLLVLSGCGQKTESIEVFAFCRSKTAARPYVDMHTTKQEKIVLRLFDEAAAVTEFQVTNVTTSDEKSLKDQIIEAIQNPAQPIESEEARVALTVEAIHTQGKKLSLLLGETNKLARENTETTMSCALPTPDEN